MIGSERGGDRVIGNYGMRREFEFSLFHLGAGIPIFLLFWLVSFKIAVEVTELEYGVCFRVADLLDVIRMREVVVWALKVKD